MNVPAARTRLWTSRNRRLAAYLLMALAGIFGLLRLEDRANTALSAANVSRQEADVAKESAAQAQRFFEQFKAEVDKQLLDSCKSGNVGRLNIRQTLEDIIAIATQPTTDTGPRTPEAQQRIDSFIAQFKKILEQRLPLRDCNGDMQVDEDDGIPAAA